MNQNEIEGVKFKLVKSNSCSSRLELAGTGKTPPDLMKNQRGTGGTARSKYPKSDSNNNEPNPLELPTVEEPEESVRDLVSRLENNTLNVRNKPRIIESKCIEKSDESKEPPITINSQSMEVVAKSAPEEQPAAVPEPPVTVTVNNHITVPAPLLIPPMLKGQKVLVEHQSTGDRPPKVCRNKNVDLAFAATITKATNKPAKEKENQARKSSLASTTPSSADTADSLETAPSSAASVSKTVTFSFQQQPNDDGGADDENNNTERKVDRVEDENLKPSVIAEQRKADELTSPKLVNWSLLGKFDEKQYVANDKKLIEKRKYDDMEFEEFEVLDPNAPAQQHQQQQPGECYDSLNSGK